MTHHHHHIITYYLHLARIQPSLAQYYYGQAFLLADFT